MTVTPPEPLPPAAPAPYDPKRDKNPFGVAALIVLLVGFLVPVFFFLAPIIATASAGSDIGWGVLGGFLFALIGFIPAAVLGLIAIVLAIVSLVRSNKKALGIVTLALSAPVVLFGLLTLPLILTGDNF